VPLKSDRTFALIQTSSDYQNFFAEVKVEDVKEEVEVGFDYSPHELYNIKRGAGEADESSAAMKQKRRYTFSQLKDHIMKTWKEDRNFDPISVSHRLSTLFRQFAHN